MIPVCEPTLNGNELKYVLEAVSSGWISSFGKYIEQFENSFSRFCGAKYGIACSNGTTALHLAIEALGIGKGDEVIIPTFTMIATANAIIYSGAKPVLVDSEMETWNMDVSKIEEKITAKTKAIMVVHIYGHPADMDAVNEIARKHKLWVIEDAAEAHGAEYKGRKTGNLSDVGCFSFYGNKIITTGEGGMLVTNNEKIAEKAKLLKSHAFGKPRFIHHELGYNYRMTNVQAAIGLAQMERADYLVERRRENAKRYNSLLFNVEGITTPPEKNGFKNVYWMYGILVDKHKFGIGKDELMMELEKKGIETRSFFYPMHKQPVYFAKDERFPDVSGSYPVSEELFEKGLYLPSGSSLTEEQIRFIVETIKGLKR